MAEKVEVEMGGQSRHEVAHRMAGVSREDYLRAVCSGRGCPERDSPIVTNSQTVWCVWFEESNKVQDSFPPSALQKQ